MSGKPRQQTLKAAGLVIHSQAAESNGCMSCLPFTQSRTPSQGMGHLLLSCLPTSVSPAVTTSHRHGQRLVSQVTPDFAKLTLTAMCSRSRDSLYWRLRSWQWAWPSRSLSYSGVPLLRIWQGQAQSYLHTGSHSLLIYSFQHFETETASF